MCDLFYSSSEEESLFDPEIYQYTFTIKSKIISIEIGEKRSKIRLEDSSRDYWVQGELKIKPGDYIELQYRLLRIHNSDMAWISGIRKLR